MKLLKKSELLGTAHVSSFYGYQTGQVSETHSTWRRYAARRLAVVFPSLTLGNFSG